MPSFSFFAQLRLHCMKKIYLDFSPNIITISTFLHQVILQMLFQKTTNFFTVQVHHNLPRLSSIVWQ